MVAGGIVFGLWLPGIAPRWLVGIRLCRGNAGWSVLMRLESDRYRAEFDECGLRTDPLGVVAEHDEKLCYGVGSDVVTVS